VFGQNAHLVKMNLSISGIYQQFISFYKKLSKVTKIISFSILGVVIAVAIILSIIMNSGKYSELYTNLSATEAADIYSLLSDKAVDVKVQDETTILVPTSDVATLKMQLAVDGYPKSTLSYDLFTEQSNLLTTDYQRKQMLIFQLQDRIQESIKTLQGVSDVIVTLSIPEDNSYVLADEEIPTTASVILKMKTNTELSKSQINGIENLVSNSVSGLTGENVVIIDGDGVQLNADEEANAGVSSAYLKVETVNIINDVYKDKIEKFLKPIFGENGMSVAVNVVVDFDVISSQETIYTPVIGDNGIISWVERSGKTTTETSGSSGVAGTGANTDTTTYEESANTSNTSTNTSKTTSGEVFSNDNYSAEYLVNQLVNVIEDNGGNITDISVALVINANELSDDNIKKYKELVAKTVGIPVDKIAISYAEFLKTTVSELNSDANVNLAAGTIEKIFSNLGTTGIIIIVSIIVFIALIIIAFKFILKHKKKKKLKKILINEMLVQKQAVDNGEATPKKQRPENMPGEIVLNETREQALKRQIKEFSSGNPETVAQLLRVWIKEDENS